MPNVRKDLSRAERQQIRELLFDWTIEDCLNDTSFLSSIVSLYIDSIGVSDMLTELCSDPDIIVQQLGFDPFEPEE